MAEREIRAKRFGEAYGMFLDHVIDTIIPEERRRDYRKRFLSELKTYSFKPRRNGEPRNEGCVFELEGIGELDISNPEHLAKLVKEGLHLMYQKNTSRHAFDGLLDALELRNVLPGWRL